MNFFLRAEGVKAVDAGAVEAGLPLELLMEAAGRAVAEAVRREHAPGSRAVVLCGRGNNGGDGLVCARWLRVWDYEVAVLVAPGELSGAPLAMRRALAAHGAGVEEASPERLEAALATADLAVDALYGSGFRPPLAGLEAEFARRLNAAQSARPGLAVWAVDLPSGLAANAPGVEGEPVRATRTIALTAPKPAHLFAPAAELCGRLEVAPVGIPANLLERHAAGEVADPHALAPLLPRRGRDAHKGTAGRVFVLGGLPRYPGAPALAALGAFRTGSGLVTIVTQPGAGLQAPTEATRRDVAAWTPGELEFLREEAADAVCAGMGMGPVEPDLLGFLLSLEVPLVLDADALRPALEGLMPSAKARVVLTPHPGEAGRLLGSDAGAVVKDPLGAAASLASRYRATVVLKGGPTVVAAPGALPWVNTTGNPGMASGGTGDVLSGVVAALLGQRLAPEDAARLGVYLHGRAGDLAAETRGYGLVASDLADHLPEAWLELERAGQ